MTLTEGVTFFRELIAQTDSSNTQFSDTTIKRLINRGYQHFARDTKALRKSEDITTVANQFGYVYGVDITIRFIHVDHVRYIEDISTEVGDRLIPYPGGYANLPKTILYGKPTHYCIVFPHNGEMTLVPWQVSSTAGDVIRIFGAYIPSDLGDSGSFDFSEAYTDAPVYWAVHRALSVYQHKSGGASAKANLYLGLYRNLVADAKEDFQINNDDEPWVTLDAY